MFGFVFRSAVIIGAIYLISPVSLHGGSPATALDAIAPVARAMPAGDTDLASIGLKLCEAHPERCNEMAKEAAEGLVKSVASDVVGDVTSGLMSPGAAPAPAHRVPPAEKPRMSEKPVAAKSDVAALNALMEQVATDSPRRALGKNDVAAKTR